MVKTLSLSRLSRLYLPVLSSLTLPRAFHSFSPAIPSSRSRTERAYSLKMSSASETAVVEDPYIFLEDVEADASLEVRIIPVRIMHATFSYLVSSTDCGWTVRTRTYVPVVCSGRQRQMSSSLGRSQRRPVVSTRSRCLGIERSNSPCQFQWIG